MENKNLTLVVLAAGIGHRYGGLKQIDPIGPNGEIIIDYSLYDAKLAGFDQIVFIIRKDIEEIFKEKIGYKAEKYFKVSYVFQELDSGLPKNLRGKIKRLKPWGTAHALMLCKNVVKTNFAVINSDDFYGREAFIKIAQFLKENKGVSNYYNYALIGYQLKNTLSKNGSVSRGICQVSQSNFLEDLKEIKKIQQVDGKIKYLKDDQSWVSLTGDEIVSMNFFGFTTSIFQELEKYFQEFLISNQNDLTTNEYYISEVIGKLVKTKTVQVKILLTNDKWLGITYQEDKSIVQAGLNNLIINGEYPSNIYQELERLIKSN